MITTTVIFIYDWIDHLQMIHFPSIVFHRMFFIDESNSSPNTGWNKIYLIDKVKRQQVSKTATNSQVEASGKEAPAKSIVSSL